MKIISVVGARPQFIKLAFLSKELRKNFEEIIVHTGQHYDVEMSKVFFEQLEIPEPDYNLGIKEEDELDQITKMIEKIKEVMIKEKPNLVILYGDTNSTLAAALSASRLGIKCAHVEAGPRMFDKKVPEEMNRIIADNASELLFCPSQDSVSNLKKEGFEKGVHFTGDIMIDVLMKNSEIADEKSDILDKLNLTKGNYILATIHRQVNTNSKENLSNIFNSLMESNEEIVLPLHPRTKKYLVKYGLFDSVNSKLKIIEPVKYLDMIKLQKNAKKIITDSGGIQKEAYILKVPCITLDSTTGWPETAEDGWNLLVGADKDKILDVIKNFKPSAPQKNHFGDGNSANKMVDLIKKLN